MIVAPEIFEWLDFIPIYQAPAEMRSPLREYQSSPETEKTISQELLFQIYQFPLEDVPQKVKPHLMSLRRQVRDLLATRLKTSIGPDGLTSIDKVTGKEFKL